MFCTQCGTRLPEDARFCVSCGVKIDAPSSPQPAATHCSQTLRTSQLQTLDHLIQHFSQGTQGFDNYDAVGKIAARPAPTRTPAWMIVFSIILMVLGTVDLIYAIPTFLANPITVVGVLMGLAMLAGGICILIFGKKRVQSDHSRTCALCAQEMDRIAPILYNHYLAYPDCPLDPKYVNPRILLVLQEVLLSGQANTIQEGLELLVERKRAAIDEYLRQLDKNTAHLRTCSTVFLAASLFQ